MKYQALSKEQMTELEAMGLDTSDASCMWTSIQDKDYNPISWLLAWRGPEAETLEEMKKAFPLTFKEGNAFYAYTLEDVLNKLSSEFRKMVISYEPDEWLNIAFSKLKFQITH